jgi:hypothetical protein
MTPLHSHGRKVAEKFFFYPEVRCHVGKRGIYRQLAD